MSKKTFVVSHPNAIEPLTIEGNTLAEALEKEGLDPDYWQEIEPLGENEGVPDGDSN